MRIWLINHYAVPPQYYPLARQTCFAKYLGEMGHDVTIFAASTVHNSSINLITNREKYRVETVNGIKYAYIKCHNYNNNGLKRVSNMCEFALKLPSVCKNFEKPDVIISTSMPPVSCAMGIHLGKKYKCKKNIAEIADLWPESIIAYGIAGPNNPIVIALRLLEKWIYKQADDIVFTMEGAYDYILDQRWENVIPKAKVHYINNGVDLDEFNYNKEHFIVSDRDLEDNSFFKIVYTGSIRRVNGLGRLLDIADILRNERIKFLIWGYGDELEELKERAANEKLDNVIFKGSVEKKYIPYIVSKADANYIYAAHNNLFKYGISPNKLFDYFAAEKPVILDGIVKYNPVEHYSAGIVLKDNNEKVLAESIKDFLSMKGNDYQRMCDNAKLASQEFDFKTLTKSLVQIINS